MLNRHRIQQVAGGFYALIAIMHLGALMGDALTLAAWTKALATPMLLLVVLFLPGGHTALADRGVLGADGAPVTARRGVTARGGYAGRQSSPSAARLHTITVLALVAASVGDSSALLLPEHQEPMLAGFFFLAMLLYAVAFAPTWWANLDGLRLLLVVPYGGILVGLGIVCADRIGPLMPLMGGYAAALAAVATLSAGVNARTWTGGTLFLLSSSQLAMVWFLPSAAFPGAEIVVMLTYYVGHGLLVAGILQALPTPVKNRAGSARGPLLPGARARA